MFIELTEPDGSLISVHIANFDFMRRQKNLVTTLEKMETENYIRVKETPEEIRQKIKEAQNEKG